MPFSRYLGDTDDGDHDQQQSEHVDQNVTFSTHVQFQLPNLILNAPTVSPGGGAEALPAGFFPPSSSSWFSAPDGYSAVNPFAFQSSVAAAALAAATNATPYSSPPSASASSPQSAPSSSYPLQLQPAYNHPPDHSSHPYASQLPPSVPSALGLPVYSASGFDLLSILARVVNRPYPKIYLGPVDLSCSFTITDTRRFDSPIGEYLSKLPSLSLADLPPQPKHEVIGRNCRFLQAPGGNVQRGQERVHTAPDAVAHLRKNIIADKECQVSIINYRKDGSAFINMVSVIPIRGGVHNHPDEADDIVFHVGFQVDLSEQPKAILSKLKDGTYLVNYSDKPLSPPTLHGHRDWRTSSLTMRGMSKELRALLSDAAFLNSFHLSASTHASTAIALSTSPSEPVSLDPYDGNKPLHMFLLDRLPDFLHVVSLKGDFLYAAPAVRAVLGYDPDELVGRSLTKLCHPADCVPLMRELKEASATTGPGSGHPTGASPSSSSSSAGTGPSPETASSFGSGHLIGSHNPRPVDLLFRILAKGRGYVWIECRGRLHVEPGKGRKAIILSGRLRNLPHLEWAPIARAGGLVAPLYRPLPPPIQAGALDAPEEDLYDRGREREFWSMLSTHATFLYVGAAVRDVLGWGAGEVMGKPLADFVSGVSPQEVRMAIDVEMTKVLADAGGTESAGLACDVYTKDQGTVPVHIVLYRSRPLPSHQRAASGGSEVKGNGGDCAAQAPVVCQVKLCEGTTPPPTLALAHPAEENVFEETEIERGSSWQYELQQLKFRNQRLVEEITQLETAIAKRVRRKQSLGAVASPSSAVPAIGLGISATARAAAAARLPIAYQHPASGMQPQHPSQPTQPLNAPHTGTMSSSSVLAPAPQAPPSHSQVQGYAQQQAAYAQRVRHSLDSALQGWSHYGFDHPPAAADGGGSGAMGGCGFAESRDAGAGSFNGVPMKRHWNDAPRDPDGGGGV
ncbi:hypothetical protein BN946_scf184978.g12 [Trametes cinnabarina]|uniref:PAS domain-containing protein n=1 Tax=Pycnoporus cinnabarinus TaxID=5643 RepID=A0A060SWD5_PYCCI|nr:hypothetical protein BN946_scf184978.g12 [Trametes cinnabarina]